MWLFFTLATTFLWGLAELFYKKGARPEEKFSHLKIAVCVGIVMGLHATFILATQDINYDPVNMIRYLPVSGAITSILSVAILGKVISGTSVVAIIVIVIGILGIGFLEGHGDTDRKKKLGKKMAIIAFAMPFCYAIIDALGSFLDIYYLDIELSPLVNVTEDTIEAVANTSYEFTFAICAVILLIFMRVKKVKFGISGQRDKVLAAVFETSGQFTYVYAMSGNGAIAAPIISAVCVVSLLLSRIFLKERLTKLQYFFLILVILGILTLAAIE